MSGSLAGDGSWAPAVLSSKAEVVEKGALASASDAEAHIVDGLPLSSANGLLARSSSSPTPEESTYIELAPAWLCRCGLSRSLKSEFRSSMLVSDRGGSTRWQKQLHLNSFGTRPLVLFMVLGRTDHVFLRNPLTFAPSLVKLPPFAQPAMHSSIVMLWCSAIQA